VGGCCPRVRKRTSRPARNGRCRKEGKRSPLRILNLFHCSPFVQLFTGPLNSDLRRRQSTDYLSPLNTSALGIERPRMALNTTSAIGSPSRERFGTLKRRDSNTGTTLLFCSLSVILTPFIRITGLEHFPQTIALDASNTFGLS
jgi:hypothetical protein